MPGSRGLRPGKERSSRPYEFEHCSRLVMELFGWSSRPAVSRLLEGRVTTYSEPYGLPATFGLAGQSDEALIAGT
jgi:hypothetical protein